jgi:hypothetical protein
VIDFVSLAAFALPSMRVAFGMKDSFPVVAGSWNDEPAFRCSPSGAREDGTRPGAKVKPIR